MGLTALFFVIRLPVGRDSPSSGSHSARPSTKAWFASISDKQVDQGNPFVASIRVYELRSI